MDKWLTELEENAKHKFGAQYTKGDLFLGNLNSKYIILRQRDSPKISINLSLSSELINTLSNHMKKYKDNT